MNCLETYHININNITEYNYHNYFIYCILMLCSFYMIYFGNKIVKPTLFISGAGSSIFIQKSATDLLVNNNVLTNINCNAYIGVNIALALFLGSLMCYFYKLSIFILGSATTGSITYLSTNIVGKYHNVKSNNEFITILTTSLLGGCLSMKYIDQISSLLTVLFGSFLGIYSFNMMINEPMNKYILWYIPIYSLISIHGLYIQNRRKKENKNEPLIENSQNYQ